MWWPIFIGVQWRIGGGGGVCVVWCVRTPCAPPPPDPPLHPYENWLVPPLDGRRTTAHRTTAHRTTAHRTTAHRTTAHRIIQFPGFQPAVEIDSHRGGNRFPPRWELFPPWW